MKDPFAWFPFGFCKPNTGVHNFENRVFAKPFSILDRELFHISLGRPSRRENQNSYLLLSLKKTATRGKGVQMCASNTEQGYPSDHQLLTLGLRGGGGREGGGLTLRFSWCMFCFGLLFASIEFFRCKDHSCFPVPEFGTTRRAAKKQLRFSPKLRAETRGKWSLCFQSRFQTSCRRRCLHPHQRRRCRRFPAWPLRMRRRGK